MNRYPLWKYAIIVVALLMGGLYTLPNFFGEAPAVQVSAAKAIYKVDAALQTKVVQALKDSTAVAPTPLSTTTAKSSHHGGKTTATTKTCSAT